MDMGRSRDSNGFGIFDLKRFVKRASKIALPVWDDGYFQSGVDFI
jgi:hypothetical protein